MDKRRQQTLSSLTLQGKDAPATQSLISRILDFSLHQQPQDLQHREIILITDSLQLSENSEIHRRVSQAPEALLILNLEDIELIRFAGEAHLPIQWFSARDPRELAGPLLDHYRGAYWKAKEGQLVYQNDFDHEVYTLKHLLPNETQEGTRLAAAICVSRALGIKSEVVQDYLNNQTRPQQEALNPDLSISL